MLCDEATARHTLSFSLTVGTQTSAARSCGVHQLLRLSLMCTLSHFNTLAKAYRANIMFQVARQWTVLKTRIPLAHTSHSGFDRSALSVPRVDTNLSL